MSLQNSKTELQFKVFEFPGMQVIWREKFYGNISTFKTEFSLR